MFGVVAFLVIWKLDEAKVFLLVFKSVIRIFDRFELVAFRSNVMSLAFLD